MSKDQSTPVETFQNAGGFPAKKDFLQSLRIVRHKFKTDVRNYCLGYELLKHSSYELCFGSQHIN